MMKRGSFNGTFEYMQLLLLVPVTTGWMPPTNEDLADSNSGKRRTYCSLRRVHWMRVRLWMMLLTMLFCSSLPGDTCETTTQPERWVERFMTAATVDAFGKKIPALEPDMAPSTLAGAYEELWFQALLLCYGSTTVGLQTGEMTMVAEWYYGVGNDQKGPVTQEQLSELARTGVLSPQGLVWKEGFSGWVRHIPSLDSSHRKLVLHCRLLCHCHRSKCLAMSMHPPATGYRRQQVGRGMAG